MTDYLPINRGAIYPLNIEAGITLPITVLLTQYLIIILITICIYVYVIHTLTAYYKTVRPSAYVFIKFATSHLSLQDCAYYVKFL